MKLRNILTFGILAAGSVLGGCASQKGIYVGDLANAKIGRLLKEKSIPTNIKTSAGRAYFWSSALNKGRNSTIDNVYTRWMKLNYRERIKAEIDFFADYIGNKNGWTTKSERNRAYETLWIRWFFEEYKDGLRDRPLIQLLRERGF